MSTNSSSACRTEPRHQRAARAAAPPAGKPHIQLVDVSLRFTIYPDKWMSLKQWMLDRFRHRWRGREARSAHQVRHFWALRHIHLQVETGARVGIIGPNGAGKTTLLKLISRIYTPTRGQVEVRGQVVPLMELGAAFNPELSVRENTLLHGAFFGLHQRQMQQRMPAILEFAGLAALADMPVKYLSQGMIARLAFSIATDIEPEILLVDEIFAVGDAAFYEKATRRILELMDSSKIVVMASHDLDLIGQLCQRVVLLESGHIVADGPPDLAISQYLRRTGGAGPDYPLPAQPALSVTPTSG